MELQEPLSIVDFDNKSDIVVNVNGGGLSGQGRDEGRNGGGAD